MKAHGECRNDLESYVIHSVYIPVSTADISLCVYFSIFLRPSKVDINLTRGMIFEESSEEYSSCKEWKGREQCLGVGKLLSMKIDGLIWGLWPLIYTRP